MQSVSVFVSFLFVFWATAPKRTKSCRAQEDFREFVSSFIPSSIPQFDSQFSHIDTRTTCNNITTLLFTSTHSGQFGDSVTLTCDNDYVAMPSGSEEIVCGNMGEWTLSGRPVNATCEVT